MFYLATAPKHVPYDPESLEKERREDLLKAVTRCRFVESAKSGDGDGDVKNQ